MSNRPNKQNYAMECQKLLPSAPQAAKGDENPAREGTRDKKADDNAESSSNGSDGDKGGGSGSGGGYSADCSSSDASSLEAAKASAPEKELSRLSMNDESVDDKTSKSRESFKLGKASNNIVPKTQKGGRRPPEPMEISHSISKQQEESNADSDPQWKENVKTENVANSLPQWNGVRVHHPMDPRIDLSTVGHIQTSAISAFPSNVDVPTQHHHQEEEPRSTNEVNTAVESPPPPSIDQYVKLMEVN